MTTIFVSYSRSDKAAVDQLIARLEAAGHSVWLDREGIRGGEQWRLKIVEAIEGNEVFLLVLSERSIASDHVRTEIDLAKEGKKRIIPLNLQRVAIPDTLRYQLAGLQRINLHPDFENGFQELLEALGGAPEKAPALPDGGLSSASKGLAGRRSLLLAGIALLVVLALFGATLIARGFAGGGDQNPPALAEQDATEQVVLAATPASADLQSTQAEEVATEEARLEATPTPADLQPTQARQDAPAQVSDAATLAPVDLEALTTIEELEPLLLQANIQLSDPQDAALTRSYFTGPDSAYHMLAVAALKVVGERRFVQPIHLDIVDKWYTLAAGSGYAERGPLDPQLVEQSLVAAYNDYYADTAPSLDVLLEPLN
jgi:hypothetical protein